MATTGILGAGNVVFYHPLDDFVESAVGQTWTGSVGVTAGKIGSSASAVTGDAFSAGPANAFDTSSQYHVIAALSATKVAMTYKSSGNRHLFIVGTLSGTDITWGTALDIDAAIGEQMGMAAMSATTVMVAYRAGDSTCHAYIVTVSGTTATKGPLLSFTTLVRGPEIRKIDATHAAIAFTRLDGGSDTGQVTIATISGTTITVGADHQFDTGLSFRSIGLAVLGATTLLVGWRLKTGNAAKVVVGTVSGTDVTYGAIVTAAATVDDVEVRVTKLTSTTAFVMYRASVNLRARIATVSGADVTLGVEGTVQAAATGDVSRTAISSTELAVVFRSGAGNPQVKKVTVSGTDITSGASTQIGTGANTFHWAVEPVSADTVVTAGVPTGGASFSTVAALNLSASMTAPTPAAYPDATGNDRLVVALWANKLGAGSSVVTVQRDFTVVFDATSISLGPATAVWSGAAVATLMGTTMASGEHFLVLDFVNTGGGNWTLDTSLDGAAFVAQGAQTSGSRTTAPAALTPGLSITAGASGQWIDELVMWSGDKAVFEQFTTQELANLNDLADVFGEPMNQFEENFGAPLCWQATARMPDGSVWRDSGSGPCPPVIRVPKGAGDIIVTDDGRRASPRVIEG